MDFRFRPPRTALDAAIEWTLVRAFGAGSTPIARDLDVDDAFDWTRRLKIGPRIAARIGFDQLREELGPDHARTLQIERVAVEAQTLRLRRTAELVGREASRAAIPIVFLKFLALELDDRLLPGSRWAADTDVLVDRERADELAAALAARGYVVEGLPDSDHHLPLMSHPELAPVEIHFAIPGVRVEEERLATRAALERFGLLESVATPIVQGSLPHFEVRLAHALAHGIAHHGFTPEDYPMARMLADLIDLGIGQAEPPPIERALTWIAGAVAADEGRAALDLAALLSGADLDQLERPVHADARRLLDHLLAGASSEAYRSALRLRLVRPGLSDRPAHRELLRRLYRLVVKSDAEIDVVYGPSRSRWRRLWLRLARPFHLVGRLGRSLWGLLTTRLGA